jgi:hypothetical protein
MRDELSLRRVVSIRLGCSSGGATSTVPETCRRAHCDVRIWLPRGVISGIDFLKPKNDFLSILCRRHFAGMDASPKKRKRDGLSKLVRAW